MWCFFVDLESSFLNLSADPVFLDPKRPEGFKRLKWCLSGLSGVLSGRWRGGVSLLTTSQGKMTDISGDGEVAGWLAWYVRLKCCVETMAIPFFSKTLKYPPEV